MMKKTMTMLLTAAMILSMSVTAFAAEAKYSVSVDDDLLTVNNGETKATYQLEDSKLSLSKSNDGGIALSFRTEDEGGKKVTLGEQKDVAFPATSITSTSARHWIKITPFSWMKMLISKNFIRMAMPRLK